MLAHGRRGTARAAGRGASRRLVPVSIPHASPSSARSVLVTGASRGIGRAVAAAFAAAGERVAGLSRSGDAPDGVVGMSVDVTDTSALRRAVARARMLHGPIEVLVACAGASRDALAIRSPEPVWADTIAVNLTAAFTSASAVLPDMLRARRGRIVLVSSVVAARGGTGQAAYAASKGGVEGLTRALAREVASRGVGVNAVAPGFVDTGMTAGLSQEARAAHLAAIPMGRLAAPREVVAPILFLASSEASYVTGTVLGVDGGMGMGR